MTMQVGNANEMHDEQFIDKVHKTIIDTYGINGYIRYIRLMHPANKGQDYLTEQDKIFEGMTVKEIYDKAVKK